MVGALVIVLLLLLVLASGAATIAGFMGEKGWQWDLTSHFRLVWMTIQLVALLVFLVGRQKFFAGITAIFLVLNLSQILPYFIPPLGQPPEAELAARIKVLQMNVWEQNQDYGRVIDFIRTEDPEFFALEECGPRCNDYIRESGIRETYSHRIYVPDNRIALYSKRSLKHWILNDTAGRSAIIVATAMVGDRPVKMFVIHSDRPTNRMREYQIKLFQRLVRLIKSSPEPVILMGDFNSTPWSVHFRRLLAETKLKNTMAGFGVYPTYPAYIPDTQIEFPFTVIPIDHVLVSGEFVTLSRRNGHRIGSDHIPVVVELGLKK